MSERIRSWLEARAHDEPCLVVDLEVVAESYRAFAEALPDTRVYYAVKANPAAEILALLAGLGSAFDCASIAEIELVLKTGVGPERIAYGSTIKKERDIARAFSRGIRSFAFDSEAELGKIARAAPGSSVVCRLLCDGAGAEWPLSRKFGCDPQMAIRLLQRARDLALDPAGVSFHVGSQQPDPEAWDDALRTSAHVFEALESKGIDLRLVNLGGGFPAHYLKPVAGTACYGEAIRTALHRHFGNRIPATAIEPGRGLVADAGLIRAEVVLVSRKHEADPVRWVYLDIGKFGGLAETMDEAIRYPIRTPRDEDALAPAILAGPTCDSADVLYEHEPYMLPVSLEIGDPVLIEAAGAYTSTYASVGFNGFAPLRSVCI